MQLSQLLYLTLSEVERGRSAADVAGRVSEAYGRVLTPEGFARLATTQLEPLGLVHREGSPAPTSPPRARPLLALTFKGTLLPEHAVVRVAGPLRPLFWPPVVALAVVGLVALDLVLALVGDFWAAVTQLFVTPTLALVMVGVLVLAAVVHEVGHATACRYGGARPGAIGVGIYLVFPAFYTDVTDSYRLDRRGRLRTDLGGLYFNVLTALALGGLFLATGQGLVLLILIVLQVQMLQQLVPVVRFDGYYVLADLAGVPDLFARVGPVLRSLRPGHPPDPRVTELRPRSRRLVTGWVLLVVPVLAAGLVWLVWALPEFVDRARMGLDLQRSVIETAWPARDWPMLALAVLSMVLICLPLLGIAVLFWRAITGGVRLVSRRRRRDDTTPTSHRLMEDLSVAATQRQLAQGRDAPAQQRPPPRPPSAADFTDAAMLAPAPAVPTLGWRRTLYQVSGRRVNLGPGARERRIEELQERLRTPIEGARRVTVMSRKGGVGKTTMTLALGSTFALQRGDRVVAVDANPDAGNLAHRVAVPRDRTITDVLRDAEDITSYASLRGYTAQAPESRLEVLASDDDPRIGMALGRTDYHRLLGLLDRYYNLIVLDTGTGILDSANQGLLTEADQLVLVLGPGLDGGRAAALTLDWLDEHDFGALVRRAVVVINGVRDGADVPVDPMRRHFERRCNRVLIVPWDPALENGAQTDLSVLRPRTRDSLLQVAAAVAETFHDSGARP
ncbi:AAA family ATPase [Nocardioides sp.]|uniref:nucleotide-binding protein n=1 Tax=Nocardioides sp. TaxID=35761 RepID=UPI002ED426C8